MKLEVRCAAKQNVNVNARKLPVKKDTMQGVRSRSAREYVSIRSTVHSKHCVLI